jgi:hypothetical protein
VSVGIDCAVLLDPAPDRLRELEIESTCEAAGDLILSLGEIGAIGLETIRPEMAPGSASISCTVTRT